MGDRLGRSEKTVPKSRSNHFQQARVNGRAQARLCMRVMQALAWAN